MRPDVSMADGVERGFVQHKWEISGTLSGYTLLSYAMMASDEKKYNTFRRALQAEKRRNGGSVTY